MFAACLTVTCASAPNPARAPSTAGDSGFTLVSNDGLPTRVPAPGRATVVDYWAPSCEPCRKKLPDLVAQRPALSRYRADLVLVAVLADGESTEQAEETLRAWGIAGERFLVDRDDVSLNEAGVTSLPTTQLYDNAGALAWTAPRNATARDVVQAVRAFAP